MQMTKQQMEFSARHYARYSFRQHAREGKESFRAERKAAQCGRDKHMRKRSTKWYPDKHKVEKTLEKNRRCRACDEVGEQVAQVDFTVMPLLVVVSEPKLVPLDAVMRRSARS